MYYFLGYLTLIVFSLFGFVKVYDRYKLPPKDEGYVVACTHTGWVDILWLGAAMLPRQVNYMAKKELFENKFLEWLLYKLKAFPVDRENPGPSAIKTPRKLIREGEVVGIFPSGTRTTEEAPLKRGAVTIAAYAKAPIVPAAYVGPNNFKEIFRFQRPRLIFGDPIYLRNDLPRDEAMDLMMRELNDAMYSLQARIEGH